MNCKAGIIPRHKLKEGFSFKLYRFYIGGGGGLPGGRVGEGGVTLFFVFFRRLSMASAPTQFYFDF